VHNAVATEVKNNAQTIEFVIMKKETGNTLRGKFKNIQQQEVLRGAATSPLVIENSSTNETLVGDEVVELTKKILPHFLAHYSQGSISYDGKLLIIKGLVDSYKSQREMQSMLGAYKLASRDDSTVVIAKPIEFSIVKDARNMHFSGTFGNKAQMQRIRSKLPQNTSTNLTQASNRIDNGVIATTEEILPDFSKRYTNGKITYNDELYTVSGTVETNEDLMYMRQLLSDVRTPIVNQTVVDMNSTKKDKPETEKKIVEIVPAIEEKTKESKKEEPVVKQKEKDILLQSENDKKSAKEEIIHLLQLENIEFKTAKGSLTKKGEETVDKLALILKQYSHIKIEIAGHTDSDGSAKFNQKLSQSRVESVKRRVVSKGVDASRLIAIGYGESKPLVPNTTDENKQKNRRVEINILGE